ncbi:sphingomyelin phosphodiesterase 1-like [Chironomus tepperi]|uniref:sphingomyelin phosphodiesterase 1-like n=1 Tax=Chironomus tepperi TaxID=113505 RepID=UPI00391F385C
MHLRRCSCCTVIKALCWGTKMLNVNDEEQTMETDEESFEADLKNYIENGKRSDEFNKVVDSIKEDGFNKPSISDDARIVFPSLRCIACRGTLAYILGRRRMGDSRDNLAWSATNICRLATSFSIEVCEGLVNVNIDTILFVIDSRPKLTQKSICALFLQQECGELDESLNFHLNIAPLPSKSTKPNSIKRSTSQTIKIIQFTDIHFDPEYVVGGNANCNDPLCCRKGSISDDTVKAGYWGDYRKCDMPFHLVKTAIRHMAEQHSDADFIYFTGDFVAHNVWDTTVDKNMALMDKMYQLMIEAFGSKVIYPILGNHEAHPVNV